VQFKNQFEIGVLQVRGRLKEAAEKKRLEKEKKEVPDEVKEKFKEWNK
jgi:uncharacterized protein (UPF0335 family)